MELKRQMTQVIRVNQVQAVILLHNIYSIKNGHPVTKLL